jgi:hypothetical protein
LPTAKPNERASKIGRGLLAFDSSMVDSRQHPQSTTPAVFVIAVGVSLGPRDRAGAEMARPPTEVA